MKHKNILAIALVLMLAMLSACGQPDAPAPSASAEGATTAAPTTTAAPETTPQITTTAPTVPMDTTPLIPQDRIDGTYEQWLAAAAIMASYLEYPDAQIQGIYARSSTPFESKMQSQGIVLQLLSGGGEVWVQCMPLDAQRTQSGTKDLYAIGLDFNTYDVISTPDVSGAAQLSLDSLMAYAELTLLPSIYYHP